jgi:hypothetical protein
MAEWTICPNCQLKHTRRPDGHCPRCKQSVDGGAGAGVETEAPAAEPSLTEALGGGAAMPAVYDGRPPAGAPRPSYGRAGEKAKGGLPMGLIFVGGFLAVGLAVIVVIGVFGRTFLASMRYAGQLESTPVVVLRGDAYQYHLTPASPKWFLRKKEAARKDNALCDRWIVRPDKDAHVFVIAERVPSAGQVDMNRFVEVVSNNARVTASKFQVLATEPLSPVIASRLLEVRATFKTQDVHGYYGLFAQEPYIYQVVAMVSETEFATISDDLKRTVASFEPE